MPSSIRGNHTDWRPRIAKDKFEWLPCACTELKLHTRYRVVVPRVPVLKVPTDEQRNDDGDQTGKDGKNKGR